MKKHLNTLFVLTQGAYLKKEGQAIVVRIEKTDRLRLPMINIAAIVCFGRVSCSPYLLGACAQRGIAISFMTEHGRFLAAVNGFTPGNVLLRREQYRRADSPEATATIARACIVGKLANYRTVLRRANRDQQKSESTDRIERMANRIDLKIKTLQSGLGAGNPRQRRDRRIRKHSSYRLSASNIEKRASHSQDQVADDEIDL